MNTKQTLGLCTVLLFALFAAVSQAKPPKAVFNVRQDVDSMDVLADVDPEDGDYVDDEDEAEDDDYVDDEDESEDDSEEVEDDSEEVEDDEEEVEDDAEEVEDDEEEVEDDAEEVEDDEEEVEDDAEDEAVEEDEEEDDEGYIFPEEEDTEEEVEEDEEEVEDDTEEVEEDEEEVEDDTEEVEEDEEEVEDDTEEVEEDEEVVEDEEEVEDDTEEVEEDEEVVEDDTEEVEEDEEEVEDDTEEVEEDEEEIENDEDEIEEADPLDGLDEDDEIDEVEDDVEDDEDEIEEADPLDDLDEDEDDGTDETEDDDEPFSLEEDEDDDQGGAAPAAAAAEVDPLEKSLSEIALLEEIRRRMFDQHGRESLEEGQRAIQNGSWGLAVEKFQNALEFLQDKESTHGLRQQAYEGLAEAYYRMALEQTDFKSYEEAEKSIREARGYIDTTSPIWAKLESLLKKVRELKEHPPVEPPPPRVPRWVQDDFRKQREDFSKRMSMAREYYATGEYRESRMHVEEVLKKDPYYKPALDLLRKIHLVEHRYAADEFRTTREGMIKNVTASWTARNNYGTEFKSLGVEAQVVDPNEANKRLERTTDEVRIREKMERIMLDSIEYRQANIVDVINELSDLSRENDTSEGSAEEKGINFMLNVGPDTGSADAGAAAAAEDDFWGEGAGGDGGGDGSYAGIPPLTIKLRYISLKTALDTIMEMSGLKYRINGNIVMIMRKNATTEDMQHRMYSVLPSIQEVQLKLGTSRAGGSGDAGDPWQIGGAEREANNDWKTFFGDLGVAWPDGSSIKYMPTIGKLVVRNTPDNLATLEQVLGALNVTPFQVEIEVRFVEVSQLDLNSLGLEWILNDDYELVENKNDRGLPVASRRRGVIESGSFNRGFNYLNKNTRLGVNDGSGVMDNIATFTSILSNPEFSVVLHALSNRSNTDMLSAPKVTARTGTTATIKTVTEYVYPTEYEVKWPEESDSNTVILQDGSMGSMTLPAVEPQEFNTREVGVILQVTPSVSSDGTRISLDLTPTVVSDPSWKDYGYTYPIDYRSGEGFHLTMEQPFFPVRSLATSVDIYNGCTVVMGGMIREERFTEEDKIPILGDIPLIGWLFRYKYEQSDKRNLLIFVTARLVDPAGREITGGASELLTGVQSDTKQ